MRTTSGFTLIEISIVLVIIALIVGGVLVGQDLIRAAEVRAQISQLEKYNTAVNTFRGKFNGDLPGDMIMADAQQFGFSVAGCNGTIGQRDGNGYIDGQISSSVSITPFANESALFWQDLSTQGLTAYIDGKYPNGSATASCSSLASPPGSTQLSQYVPPAKIGHNMYVMASEVLTTGIPQAYNAFYVQGIQSVLSDGSINGQTGIPVSEVYAIDVKVDDGLPVSGRVRPSYINNSTNGSNVNGEVGNPDTTSTCFNSSTLTYSLSINGGSGPNCALRFQFQ